MNDKIESYAPAKRHVFIRARDDPIVIVTGYIWPDKFCTTHLIKQSSGSLHMWDYCPVPVYKGDEYEVHPVNDR